MFLKKLNKNSLAISYSIEHDFLPTDHWCLLKDEQSVKKAIIDFRQRRYCYPLMKVDSYCHKVCTRTFIDRIQFIS